MYDAPKMPASHGKMTKSEHKALMKKAAEARAKKKEMD